MASYTVANLPRISREKLAELVRSKAPGLTIIDVRDNDYIGGHIINCLNIPTSTHDFRMPELVRTLRNQKTVIFHCALSQQRGPSSALRYLRERDRLTANGEVGVRTNGGDLAAAQKVFVLDGGFVKWQELYGKDKELTEGYDEELWNEEMW